MLELSHDEIGLLLNWSMWKEDESDEFSKDEIELRDKIFDLYGFTVNSPVIIKKEN